MKSGGNYSRAELMDLLSLKHRVNFYENHLRPALEEDRIEMTIPDKPNSRLQKYRLTEKGRNVLETL